MIERRTLLALAGTAAVTALTGAAKAHEPHRIAFYLYDLSSAFHAHWARGNDLPHLRFIQRDEKLTAEFAAFLKRRGLRVEFEVPVPPRR